MGCVEAGDMRRDQSGSLLMASLFCMGFLSCILAAYFSNMQSDIRMVMRSAARTQALYAAEAGLDAASDLLSQDWDSYRNPRIFPLRESLTASADGVEVTVGEFEVTVRGFGKDRLRLISTGRSLSGPKPGRKRDHEATRYQIERTLSAVIVGKMKPSFQRQGGAGVLALETGYLDVDGVPDFLRFSGKLNTSHGRLGFDAISSSGGDQEALNFGNQTWANFADLDGDGDLDLILYHPHPSGGDVPTVASKQAQAASGGDEISSTTMVDVFHTGKPIPIMAPGWVFLPLSSFSASEPGAEVFLNTPLHDGTLLVSWGEQLPAGQ